MKSKINIVGRLIPDSGKKHQNQEVYATTGGSICCTLKATHYKDPIKVLICNDLLNTKEGSDLIMADEKQNDSTTSYRIRKLTPKECWRLMGFSDEDFEKARARMIEKCYNGKDRCQTQLYKQAGNSIVVDVLYHIMKNLKTAMPYLFENMEVGSFFSGIGAFELALKRVFEADEKENEATIESKNCAEETTQLRQIGCLNHNNSVGNRIYDDNLARTLTALAGGGGGKNRLV